MERVNSEHRNKKWGGMSWTLKEAKRLSMMLFIALSFPSFLMAARHISDTELWKHVVTVDRLAWKEREGIKKVNKLSRDSIFVRRLYLDITGKIPTYEELEAFLKDKNINKRQDLIDELLDSKSYASNFTNMWSDLLRIPYNEGGTRGNHDSEFKRYIEREIYENVPYDRLVHKLLMSEGHVSENGAVSFYVRDRETGVMDTVNATVRAFLGTRIGCAQCHNHRFDKWTQKQFYETSAYLWGIKAKVTHNPTIVTVLNHHIKQLKDHGFKGEVTKSMRDVLNPSRHHVSYNEKEFLVYPENYVYDNAKPFEKVKESLVFGYGDEKVEGESRREVFANWLTSKNNPMFARVMANRLWKRIMGVALMEPVDDWKDDLIIQNPDLFTALGDVFVSVNYDFKAFLSIIFNSEAYQMAVDENNELDAQNYRMQGAALKRMSAPQLFDSLLTLAHGDLEPFSKMGSDYFEFEDRLKKLITEFYYNSVPKAKRFFKKYGRDRGDAYDSELIEDMLAYAEKVRALEEEYNVAPNGRIRTSYNKTGESIAKLSKNSGSSMMMQENSAGSSRQQKGIVRASLVKNPENFLDTFGATDRSAPETGGSYDASIKQILKMINSKECKNVVKKDSYLMKNMYKRENFNQRISYLYYSLYGRVPNKKELGIAAEYVTEMSNHKKWEKYVLALMNSPEFYFIQ